MVGIHRLRENEQKMLSDFFRNFDFLGVFFSFFCYFFKNLTNWKKNLKSRNFMHLFSWSIFFVLWSNLWNARKNFKTFKLKKKTPKKSKFRKKSLRIFRSFSLDLWIPTIHKKSKKMAIPKRGEGGGTKLSIMHYKKPNKSRMQQVYLK